MTPTPARTATHTAGPWHVEWFKDSEGWAVYRLTDILERDEQLDANARLIAAAPLLLSALRSIVNSIGNCPNTTTEQSCLAIAEKAITHADGQRGAGA